MTDISRSSTRDVITSGISIRAIVVSILLAVLSALWIRQSEVMVLATQVSESVPAIPALTALVVILAANGLMRFTRRGNPFSTAEIVVIFLFVAVSSTTMGIGVVQFIISLVTTPYYYHTDNIQKSRPFLPPALAPHSLTAIKHLYEGAPTGQVPWHLWLVPITLWLSFFVMLWICVACAVSLFYRSWAFEERLSFPLVALPLNMVETAAGGTPFFRNRLMWAGFAIAACYNGLNIAHALQPQFPAPGKSVDFGVAFTSLPFSEMKPLVYHIRPELIGLGFLVSTDISLTVWAAYLVFKVVAVSGAASGVPPGLLPYSGSQAIGAYTAMAGVMVWLARRHLRAAWHTAWRGRETAGPEGVTFRLLFLGAGAGFLFCWVFMWRAGLGWWPALLYLLLVTSVALVYARLRAEAGVPLVWLFPFEMQHDVLLNAFGSAPFSALGPGTLPVFTMFLSISRGYFPELCAYQGEGLELARRTGASAKRIFQALIAAVALGFLLGWYVHLTSYYRYGAMQLRGGIWGDWVATAQYSAAYSYSITPKLVDTSHTLASAFGALSTVALWAMRLRYAGFWFNPIGYCMTCSFGSLIWGPFLTVWILKSLTLRYGGMGLYKKLVPFFLGLALGHFAIAGILWGLTGVWAGSAVQGYQVYFG